MTISLVQLRTCLGVATSVNVLAAVAALAATTGVEIPAVPLEHSESTGAHSPSSAHHVTVYMEPGRFGGWPANHGLWSWNNEILAGFSRGFDKDLGERHHIDREKPEEHLLARSLDGGETWSLENPSEQGALIPAGPVLHGIAPPGLKEKPWRGSTGVTSVFYCRLFDSEEFSLYK